MPARKARAAEPSLEEETATLPVKKKKKAEASAGESNISRKYPSPCSLAHQLSTASDTATTTTPFREKVYEIVRSVPPGKVATYKRCVCVGTRTVFYPGLEAQAFLP